MPGPVPDKNIWEQPHQIEAPSGVEGCPCPLPSRLAGELILRILKATERSFLPPHTDALSCFMSHLGELGARSRLGTITHCVNVEPPVQNAAVNIHQQQRCVRAYNQKRQ